MPNVQHVAMIMDGNGRWARKRGLPRVVGHQQGVETVRTVVKCSKDLLVKYLTLYAFSTENWNRPKEEVSTLMKMLKDILKQEIGDLHKNNVRVNAMGRLHLLGTEAHQVLDEAMELTKNNTALVLTICLSYGGRSEIVDAVKKMIEHDRKEKYDLSTLDEETFATYLYDASLPDPDLLIRTGAEKRERISNFLLWQIAYTEIYFTKTLWPDFSAQEYKKAVQSFKERERLFGRVKEFKK